MSTKGQRSTFVTAEQKRVLIEYIENYPALSTGQFSPEFTKKKAQLLWQEIAEKLNSIPGGACKEWLQWRKTWQDLKKNVKAKASKLRVDAQQTGGGAPSKEVLDDTETQIFDMIQPVCINGNTDVSESAVTFSFDKIILCETEPTNDDVPRDILSDITTKRNVCETGITNLLVDVPSKSTVMSSTSQIENTPIRRNRVRRLQTSMDIGKDISQSANDRNKIAEEYYREKLENTKLYRKEKLRLLSEKNEIQKQLLEVLQKFLEEKK